MNKTDHQTIIDLLYEKCKLHNEKTFLLFEDNEANIIELTYAQFLKRVNKLSNIFLQIGVEKGDKVTLHLPNSSDFIVTWFALANIGAVMVPTNILSTASEMDYLINNSESILLITEEEYIKKFESIKDQTPQLKNILLTRCLNESYKKISIDELLKNASDTQPNIKISSEDVVSILYTSGTTSNPKGCLITHANYLYTGEAVAKSIELTESDRAMIVLPLFHGNGQYYMFMPALTVGGSIAITERFSASRYIKQTKRLQATVGSLFAAPIRMILAQDYDEADKQNLLRVILFAQSVTDKQLQTFQQHFNVSLLQLYGMTETVAPPLMNPLEGSKDNNSIGKPIASAEIRLIDEAGNDVGENEAGQIILRGVQGQTLMKGYYNNEDETKQTIKNGWLHTGDQAVKTSDGYYYFVDRKKDMIKRAGENIAAIEVENAIMIHSSVYEAVVISVPDPIRDEAIHAFVILKDGETATEEDIIGHCLVQLAKFKVPDIVYFVDDFPRTSVGKIQKHKLRTTTK